MGWRVRWTTPAWAGVEEQARFIARDSPRYAVVLLRSVSKGSNRFFVAAFEVDDFARSFFVPTIGVRRFDRSKKQGAIRVREGSIDAGGFDRSFGEGSKSEFVAVIEVGDFDRSWLVSKIEARGFDVDVACFDRSVVVSIIDVRGFDRGEKQHWNGIRMGLIEARGFDRAFSAGSRSFFVD